MTDGICFSQNPRQHSLEMDQMDQMTEAPKKVNMDSIRPPQLDRKVCRRDGKMLTGFRTDCLYGFTTAGELCSVFSAVCLRVVLTC